VYSKKYFAMKFVSDLGHSGGTPVSSTNETDSPQPKNTHPFFSSPLFIEVAVPSLKSKRSYICALEVSIWPLSAICVLDF
jgi:hypothetical protein